MQIDDFFINITDSTELFIDTHENMSISKEMFEDAIYFDRCENKPLCG